MYKGLIKDTIANEIIPHLSVALSYFYLIGICVKSKKYIDKHLFVLI